MYDKYNDQSYEHTGPVFANSETGDHSPMHEIPGPYEPEFEGQPLMHGDPHHGGPDFDGRPPMHGGPHHGGPDFDGRPPMHGGPHHGGSGFDGRPPMHGGPHHGGPGFDGRPPMHGGPHHGSHDFDGRPPMHGSPEFGERPPMYDAPESFGAFHELPFDIPGQYETLPVDGKLMHNFRLLSHQIHAAREGAAGQQRILTILSAVPAVSQRQLMELLGVRAGTLSEVIGKLEVAGKIRRVPNPNDRRMLMVSITPKGMDSINERKENSSNLFETLTAGEKQTLLVLLEKILTGKTPPARNSNETFEC